LVGREKRHVGHLGDVRNLFIEVTSSERWKSPGNPIGLDGCSDGKEEETVLYLECDRRARWRQPQVED